MSVKRWQQVEEIFQSALDLSPTERSNYVSQLCSGDPELKKEVEKLLADYDSANSFIENPVWTDRHFFNSLAKAKLLTSLEENLPTETNETDHLIGTRIGAFELKKEIGRGGMGAVYLAERADGEFVQKVAVKLIKRGMDSDFIIRRFRHERQILASFEHPFIGRLLDGGKTGDDLPYFVMEFVEGDTLYDYCDKNKLNIHKRIEIFTKICAAVSYAHERQVIHRDIKPGNILVSTGCIPKLLDFGIAKILDSDLIHESINPTSAFVRLMTPDYASPEQVSGKEITIASDIYSLGILLYELLTGHRPYKFEEQSLHEISRVVCEILPKLPSRILGEADHLLPKYAQNADKFTEVRGTNQRELKEILTGDLDNIIMQSLAKELSSRYKTVREFSDDLKNFLNGEEIGRAKEFRRGGDTLFSKQNQDRSNAKALAVLPFKYINLADSNDANEDFLSLGLADALITRLSKIRCFAVRPTSSVLGFGGKACDPIKAGIELEADYVLDGNIKRAGERLRITVQLLSVAENSAVWAASIDETVSDIFYLEDTIATRVVQSLLPQITGGELEDYSKRGTESPAAFEQYLRGRYFFNSSTEEGLAKAFVCFHEAITADPNYAHAYVGLSDYYDWLGIFGVLPPRECFQLAIEAAEKAVQLDKNSAEAHAALGFSVHAGNYDWSKAEYHLSRALELNPNYATAYAWFAIVRFTQGHFTEAFEFAERAIELDPLTPYNHHNIGWGLYFARRFDESINQYRQVISHFPNYGLGYYGLSKILRFVGRAEESLQEIENAKKFFGDSIFVLTSEAESLAANDKKDEARIILENLEQISENRYVSPYQLSLIYCFLNEKEKALSLLEEALEIKEAWLNWLGVEPVFDILRDEPRFQNILVEIGYQFFFNDLSIYDEKTIRFTQNYRVQTSETKRFETAEESSKQISAETARRKKSRQKLPVYFAAILIFLSIFGFSYFYNKEKAPNLTKSAILQPNSIVILPFQSENSTDEILGVGLADALSNRLGNIKRLSVISPNSGRIMAKEEIEKIGSQLRAKFILRGKIQRKSEQNVSIETELINSENNVTIWAEEFTTDDENFFEIQTKIAEKIWAILDIEPMPNERLQISKLYTNNKSAYELYLIGRFQLSTRSPENLRKAIASFSQARTEDPEFALAYAGLADAYALLKLYEMPPPADAFQKAKENALKALEIDDKLAEAHTSLAYIKFYEEGDQAGAELEFRRAIQINPSYSQAHHWFAILLMATNRPLEAIDEIQTAEQLNPRSLIVRTALGMMYVYNKQYAEALTECERVLVEDAGFVPALRVKRWVYQAQNDYKSARAAFQKERSYSGGEPEHPGWYIIEAQVEAMTQNKKEISARLDRAIEDKRVKNYPATYAYEIALAYNALGETAKAFAWLEKGKNASDNGVNMLGVDPRFENLRSDIRFQKIQQSINEKR